MNRFVGMTVVAVVLGWASVAQAQAYTVYYPAPAVAAPVTTYYAPSVAYYAPQPRMVYYTPPVTYYRPLLGGWRYNYAPVSYYRYPVTTAYYYPAY